MCHWWAGYGRVVMVVVTTDCCGGSHNVIHNSKVLIAYKLLLQWARNETFHSSLQNKCRTADIDRQNLGRSGKLSFFIIYKFWQNCASVRQVSDLILKTVTG